MFKRNNDIREAKETIPMWVIAERIGIHENTFYHWMRKEMTYKEKQKILAVIDEIKNEMKEGS